MNASNLWYLGEGLFGPLFAVFSAQLGGTLLDVTWAWAIYMVVTGFATMAVGKIALNTRRQQWLAVLGYSINTLMTFGYAFVSTPFQLTILQMMLGVAQAFATPTWYALYTQFGTKTGSDAWGQVQGQSNIVTGLAFVVGGLIATYVSFTALFVMMGLVQLAATISMVAVLFVREEIPYLEPEQA